MTDYRQGDREIEAVTGREVCYVVQAGSDGPIKIGHSVRLAGRISGLQTGHASQIRVLAVLDGGRQTEREAHRRFAAWKLSGEWFHERCSPLICQWLDADSRLLLGGRWTDAEFEGPASEVPLPQKDDPHYVPREYAGWLEANYYCRGWNSKRLKYCRNRSGMKTDHFGSGRCSFHGGRSPIKHGRFVGKKLRLRHPHKSTVNGTRQAASDSAASIESGKPEAQASEVGA